MSGTYNTWLSSYCRRGWVDFGTVLIFIDYTNKRKRLHIYTYFYVVCQFCFWIKKKCKTRKKKTIIVYKIDKITLSFFVYRIAKEHDSIFDFFFSSSSFFFIFQNKHHLVSLHFLLAHTPVYVCQRTIS
jgi:hypothetical protein